MEPSAPPKAVAIEVVAAQPTEADSAAVAHLSARDQKAPEGGTTTLTPPPPSNSIFSLPLGIPICARNKYYSYLKVVALFVGLRHGRTMWISVPSGRSEDRRRNSASSTL